MDHVAGPTALMQDSGQGSGRWVKSPPSESWVRARPCARVGTQIQISNRSLTVCVLFPGTSQASGSHNHFIIHLEELQGTVRVLSEGCWQSKRELMSKAIETFWAVHGGGPPFPWEAEGCSDSPVVGRGKREPRLPHLWSGYRWGAFTWEWGLCPQLLTQD